LVKELSISESVSRPSELMHIAYNVPRATRSLGLVNEMF
jgi:hypothetical protein